MTTTAHEAPGATVVPDDAAGVVAFAREQRRVADQAEARLLQAAVQWAVIHPAESVSEAETYTSRSGLEGVIPIAGPGAPLVAEFAVAELGAALGLSTEAGKHYLGQAVELRYRLPRLWARVMCGDLPAWKARRVADRTIGEDLTVEAASYVDRHVAPMAHRIRPSQLDRLLTEAIARFMPDQVEERRREAADRRHFSVDTDHVTFDGTSFVEGELDLADALDLDDAVRAVAGQLKDLGSTESLDVRRSIAVGELARRQLALDLTDDDGRGGSGTGTRRRPVRRTVLHLHLSQAALAGQDTVGRCETTRTPVTAEAIRAWCGHPDTHLIVQPVLDLADHVHVDSYETRGRIPDAVALRDHSCVFPWCTRPARKLRPDGHGCDHDHTTPYRQRPQTCSCGIAPLCRHHHRLKTHGGWCYRTLVPGTYLWTSPHGHEYLRDHAGTQAIEHRRD